MPRKIKVTCEGYLAFVRQQRCCGCGAHPPSDPHHFDERGIGQKCDDMHTSPLCAACHGHFHQHGLLPNSPSRAETERTLYRAQARSLVRWHRMNEARGATPEQRADADTF